MFVDSADLLEFPISIFHKDRLIDVKSFQSLSTQPSAIPANESLAHSLWLSFDCLLRNLLQLLQRSCCCRKAARSPHPVPVVRRLPTHFEQRGLLIRAGGSWRLTDKGQFNALFAEANWLMKQKRKQEVDSETSVGT